MKTQFLRSILYSIITSLTCLNLAVASPQSSGENTAHFCGVTEQQPDNRHYARSLAHLEVGEPRTVRMIYFLPNDRQPQPDIDAKLDTLIKDVQQSYAEVMEYHGFGRKTFPLETDSDGKTVVHHVNGRLPDGYYHTGSFGKVWEETVERFDPSANIYFVALDVSTETLDGAWCGQGAYHGSFGGLTVIPASGECFNVAVSAHELGHAFGLAHDRLRNANRALSSYHSDWMVTSFCAAEWLDVHFCFNAGENVSNKNTQIQMLSPAVSSPNSIRIRFQIADADGLHQAQLFWIGHVNACKQLNGQSDMYEFELIPRLHGNPNDVVLRVIDVHGNFMDQSYPIDIAALLPPPEVVSIPDANLATAIREALNLAPGDTFTQWNMLELINLDAAERQITDLTGFEHATQLAGLNLSSNQISNIGPLTDLTVLSGIDLGGNEIRDITPLAGLTQLGGLWIGHNQISDINPLAGLTQLSALDLGGNEIRDIAPLAGLTQLDSLWLWFNHISDISAVAGLTRLTGLFLNGNSISDLSPLVAHTGLGDGVRVHVERNRLSYPSIYTQIPALQKRGVVVHFDRRTPQRIRIISGDDQEGLPGEVLAKSFVVEIRDESNPAFEGVPVMFTVASGGGTLSATSAATDSNGRAESIFTLGPNPGTNTVEVTATGIQEKQTFTAEGIRIPKTLEIISGKDQEGLPGFGLAKPFVMEVRDQVDKPVPGVQVTFSVTSGGGTLSVTSATTDANGRAESILTLGPHPGTNTVTVSVAGIQEQQTFTAEGMRLPLAFWIISGYSQQGVLGEALAKPFVVEVRDQSGEPLPGAQVIFSISSGGGTLSGTSATTDSSGRAESILTLGPDPGTNTVEVAVTGIQGKQTVTAIAELPPIPQDVKRDDVVNILDLVLVAGAFGNVLAAPSSDSQALSMMTAADVRQWLVQAGEFGLVDTTAQRGVLFLEQLLAALAPKETALLPNYPNPFNPETWIPYQLARDADVTLTIHALNGQPVRHLTLGHQVAGTY